jgi:hypothetical protein
VHEVRLSAATPRALDAVTRQVDLRKGLYTGYVFGFVFLAGAALLPVAMALAPRTWTGPALFQMIAGPLLFAGFALVFLLPALSRHRERIEAFTHGALVTARVTGRRRAFVPYSSFRDYLIDAEARLADGRMATGTMRTRSLRLADTLASGVELQALAVPASARLLLPAEIGVEIAIA